MSLFVDIRLPFSGFELKVRQRFDDSGLTAVFGPSGSGKSTLLRVIAGLERGATGRISFGDEIWHDDMKSRPAHLRGVGYVFQDARLFPHLDVAGNLRFATRRAPEGQGPGRDEVARILDLGPLLGRRPDTLSGGERQRVAIGRALLTAPRLLLMDEPLAALDEPRKAEILPYLERLRDEMRLPILYVSHSLPEVARLASHIVALSQGQVLRAGTAAEVLADPSTFPGIAGEETGAIIETRVLSHDRTDGLSTLGFAGGQIVVPLTSRPAGSALRVRVRARDVLIAIEIPRGISALNILSARVEELGPSTGTSVDLRLKVGDQDLLARLTRRSVTALGLTPGTPCHAILKSVALFEPGHGPSDPSADHPGESAQVPHPAPPQATPHRH